MKADRVESVPFDLFEAAHRAQVTAIGGNSSPP
jgi:hypothetical protein